MAIKANSRIVLAEGGFTFETEDKKSIAVHWANVQEVVAFKRDLLIYDCVYLAFKLFDGTSAVVDEEAEGWDELIAAAEQNLKLQPVDWFNQVTLPAFRTNTMKLYERSSEQLSS